MSGSNAMGGRSAAERWAQVAALFDEASTLPPGQRAALLAQRAGNDEALVREVQALFDSAETRGDLLDRPAAALLDAEPIPGLRPGTLVGSWRIEERVGQGGMGEVYRARRADDAFEQQVALKLIRREAVDQLERFHDERRVLARLDHPGIARLFDGGVADDGRPYLVMEWVDGQPLTDWCRDRNADLRLRIEVFLQVCEAVGHAHRNLLVHRDLKPGNVLVTAEVRVKLLDFGVAKLLSPGGDLAQTVTIAPLTPAYASPEQLEQGAITTATDVYALGLILFELLTGERPFHRPNMGLAQLVDRQQRESAPAMSTVRRPPNAPPIAPRQLRGDLDAIVAKALRKEPAHRYPTVTALEDDLQRHVRNEPVAARRGARGYVLGRFVRRYRWAVGGVALLIATLVAGLAGTVWQARHAQSQAQRAETVKSFLVEMFRASDPRIASDKPRGQITAKELLDLNAPRISKEFADDPDTEIDLVGVVASIYREFDDQPRYGALHQQYIDLARERYGELHPLVIQGLLQQANDANKQTEQGRALEILAQVDPLIHRAGLDRSAMRARWWLVRSDALIADDSTRQESNAALAEATTLYEKFAPEDPGYVTALDYMGSSFAAQQDAASAAQYHSRAIAVAEKFPTRNDAGLQTLYGNLALAYLNLGDFDGAETAFAKVAEIARRTTGEQHHKYWVPAVNHAATVHARGDRERAVTMFEAVRRLLPEDPSPTQIYDAAFVNETWGRSLVREGRPEAAIPVLEAVERQYQRGQLYGHDLQRLRLTLGEAYATVGRDEEARRVVKGVRDHWINRASPGLPPLLLSRELHGRILLAQGDPSGAEAEFREIVAQAQARNTAAIALAHGDLALIAIRRGDAADALVWSQKALDAYADYTGLHDARREPMLWLAHAEALRHSGDAKAAIEWAEKALAASRRFDHPQAPSIAAAQVALANAHLDLGDIPTARDLTVGAHTIIAGHERVGTLDAERLRLLDARLAQARRGPTD